MGTIALNKRLVDNYFRFLKNLDVASKKKLIIKLTESIQVKREKQIDIRSLYGAWVDTRDADEIIKEIRDSRVNNREIEEF